MWSIFKAKKVPQSSKGTSLYDFRLGRRFDPGAMAEVFEPTLMTPTVLFRGSARLAGHLSILQPPQVWFPGQQGVVGLGGIQAGQFVGQPLIDPSQLDTEGG